MDCTINHYKPNCMDLRSLNESMKVKCQDIIIYLALLVNNKANSTQIIILNSIDFC